MLGRSGQQRDERDGVALEDKGAQAVDLGGTEGQRLPDDSRAGCRLVNLEANREVASQQPKADRDAVRVQAGAHEMVEVMPVEQFVEPLLDPPPLTVQRDEALRAEPLDVGHIHPGAPAVGRRAGGALTARRTAWVGK